MDHYWQIGPVGAPEESMLEAYTTLGYLAASTQRVLLHTLVTGVVYREPGFLAKVVSTLDVLTGGRAGLGIGAAWFKEEAEGLGFAFPPLGERFERLEETLRICLQMWGEDDRPFEGRHYRLGRALDSPAPLSRPHPFLLIGGGGERKTLRLVAQYANACNIYGGGGEAAHKLDVLRFAPGTNLVSPPPTSSLVTPSRLPLSSSSPGSRTRPPAGRAVGCRTVVTRTASWTRGEGARRSVRRTPRGRR
jgi:F420-dependent oxidoreductase-like protein